MPNREPVVLQATPVKLRLIGPPSVIWPGMTSPPSEQVQVLSKTLCARPLPSSGLPSSPDLISGSYTTRLGDAGEMAWSFPNAISSDGVPWRTRFDPTGHLMWIEVWLGGELEQVCVIDTATPSDGAGFSQTLDATDFATSLQGNGAGFQNGTAGQLQALVFDPATLKASLFDAQGWQDFSDASFPSLLQALLNSALGLRLTPWQLLSADGTQGGQGQVAVHGQDGWFLLKKAYERDWIVVQSPRDVIERGTQLSVALLDDDFSNPSVVGSTLTTAYGTWTIATSGSNSSVTAQAPAGILLTANPASPPSGTSVTVTSPSKAAGTIWRAEATFTQVEIGAGSTAGDNDLLLEMTESNGTVWGIGLTILYNSDAVTAVFQWTPSGGSTVTQTVVVPTSTTYTLMLESDGEWLWGFVNGQLIGDLRRDQSSNTSLVMALFCLGVPEVCSAVAASALLTAQQPFLEAGSDKGDYVLPGNASTYPNGGLHARYYNDADLQSDLNGPAKVLAPSRSIAYAGSGTSEYANQQDPTINGQQNPTPGAGTGFWSAKWFGAIWLPLSLGDFTFAFTLPTNGSARVWIGKTQFGQQLLDQWPGSAGTYTFTLSAASLAGKLPYGGGSVVRDGWYPIRIEYGVDGFGATAPIFYFYTTPATYTDPGGTVCPARTTTTGLVPATSLSPLGCVDQRYQGLAHFDLVQQTLQAYGYQAAVEPKALESGLFPGVLAPRIREGKDTDVILAPSKDARSDAQSALLAPRLASTWPLPGSLLPMRFRPGDGLRARDAEIGVWDKLPRQILAFTRNLLPQGISGAVASLANRPRGVAHTLKQVTYTASRMQRNYQRQLVSLTGTAEQVTLAPGTTDSGSSLIVLAAGDTLVRVRLRVAVNTGAVSFNVLVNGADVTSILNGPWTTVPLNLDIGAVATLGADNRLYVQLRNNSGTTSSTFSYQLFADVVH